MAETVIVSRQLRVPFAQASEFVTDPHQLLPAISTFSRCRFVREHGDGELWDVFLDSGTIHLGGRVLIKRPTGSLLKWRSVQGTRHSFAALVEPAEEGSRLMLTLTYKVTGLGVARLSEWLARGVIRRSLHAIVEELRHHLEFER